MTHRFRAPLAVLAVAVASVTGCTDEPAPNASRTDVTATPSEDGRSPSAGTSRRFNLAEVSERERATFDLCAHADRYARADASIRADFSEPGMLTGPGSYETDPVRQAARWHMASVAELADEAEVGFDDLVTVVLTEYETGTTEAFDAALRAVQTKCGEALDLDASG